MAHIEPTARLSVATLNDHIKKLTEPVFRKHLLLARLRERGGIIGGCTGKAFDWRVVFRRREPTRGGDMTTMTFPRVNRYRTAELPWRRLQYGEAISDFEKKANAGPEALIKLVAELTKRATDDFNEFFHTELYQDGNSTTTLNTIHGLASMLTVSAAQTYGVFAAPLDTYAGLTTTLGNYGGSWTPGSSNSWPRGTGSVEYCFASPFVVDVSNTNHAAETKTWTYTWRECMRQLSTYMLNLQGNTPDLYMLTPESFRLARQSMDDKERLEVTQGSPSVKLGFKTLSFEGVELATEYGVPETTTLSGGTSKTNHGYAITFDRWELRLLGQKQLLEVERDRDIETGTDRYAFNSWLNSRFESPCYFGQFVAVT